jgi:hypothetical protein
MRYFFTGTIIAAILTTATLMILSSTETAFAREGTGGGCGKGGCGGPAIGGSQDESGFNGGFGGGGTAPDQSGDGGGFGSGPGHCGGGGGGHDNEQHGGGSC